MFPFILQTPQEASLALADRVRRLRLDRAWTQQELADRAGITYATYRRFESTGLISLDRLLRIAEALGTLHEFDQLFRPAPATTLDELEQQTSRGHRRQRGRRRNEEG